MLLEETKEFYAKSRKKKINYIFNTIINPALFSAAFMIGASKSFRDGSTVFAAVDLLIAILFLGLFIVNLVSRIRGKNKMPDISITGGKLVISRGVLRASRVIDIESIRDIKLPQDDNLVEIIYGDSGRHLVNLAMFDSKDSDELKEILTRIKGE